MEAKFDQIIARAAENNNVDREMLKSISDFVFSETKKEMSRFSKLRITLEGLMTFFYGKTRLITFRERITSTTKPLTNFMEKKTPEEREEVIRKVDALLEEYEVFIKDRRETKQAYRDDKRNNPRIHPQV